MRILPMLPQFKPQSAPRDSSSLSKGIASLKTARTWQLLLRSAQELDQRLTGLQVPPQSKAGTDRRHALLLAHLIRLIFASKFVGQKYMRDTSSGQFVRITRST